MSSPNPFSEDELDHLVRGALQARVSGQEPPERVWERIKLELEADQSPPPCRVRASWSPLIVQAALTLLLVMLGGVGLGRLLYSDYVLNSCQEPLSPVATIHVERRSAPSDGTTAAEEPDLHLLKAQYRAALQLDAERRSRLPLRVPPDAPPHPLSPEGRLLAYELSTSPRPVTESNLVIGGPSEE
jgi:hypothetical protein